MTELGQVFDLLERYEQADEKVRQHLRTYGRSWKDEYMRLARARMEIRRELKGLRYTMSWGVTRGNYAATA